ncbi:uncharacterized protein LOC116119321 isoform X1 [Pistacia vera]|uniref:uncharacterized protein LOC116119321 isoform X1 n=2 Tax=Pistacia vera TaxID=55513 RepID=UPI001263B645|nr:uncharacterized protein LOC116119321 isoform X1 [Pistacia vera]
MLMALCMCLQVISLCWKEGSSKSGLVGMKKVAKGYKDGKRVGFVKLSPGIDLYVYPHSDSIITILAKHGFFKGMAAVVDNQDSLIGCVVWRRNIASANSAAKKSDGKICSSSGHLLNSSSNSSRKISIRKDLCCKQSTQDPIPVASETKSTTHESAGNCGNGGKHQKTSEVELELHNSSASANLSLTPSVLNPESFLQSKGSKESASLQSSVAQPEVETPLIQHKSSIEERPEPVLELQKPVLSLSSKFAMQPIRTLDNDDLPEFDFRTECGISHPMSKPLDSVTVEKKLPAEGLRKMDWSLQPAMSMVKSLSAFKQPRLEIFNLPRLPLDAIQRMPLLKEVSVNGEKQNTQSRCIMQPVSATASKNLFNDDDDDDDDMPEWCPPNVELCKRSVAPNAELRKRSVPQPTTLVHSEVPNSAFQSSSASYPSRVELCKQSVPQPTTLVHSEVPNLAFQSSSASYPSRVDYPTFTQPFPQAFPRGNHCSINITMKLMQPRSTETFVPRGFNANPALRPPPNVFSVYHPVHPTGWRGWRP